MSTPESPADRFYRLLADDGDDDGPDYAEAVGEYVALGDRGSTDMPEVHAYVLARPALAAWVADLRAEHAGWRAELEAAARPPSPVWVWTASQWRKGEQAATGLATVIGFTPQLTAAVHLSVARLQLAVPDGPTLLIEVTPGEPNWDVRVRPAADSPVPAAQVSLGPVTGWQTVGPHKRAEFTIPPPTAGCSIRVEWAGPGGKPRRAESDLPVWADGVTP